MPLKPFFHEAREIARLAHKARCVALANGFVGLCKTKGADVVVFGSLAPTSQKQPAGHGYVRASPFHL